MSERNWQEDWDMCERYRNSTMAYNETEFSKAYPHWLQEIKSLREQLAHANCEWQREKSMRYSAIAREGQEKRRADEAERINGDNIRVISNLGQREQKLKMFIEDLIKADDGSFPFEAHERWKDIAARYLKQLYGDAA